MRACEQTPGQSIYDHGMAVHAAWQTLLEAPPEALAPWWLQLQKAIQAFDLQDIKDYHIYHDCGKPWCLVINGQGRHFPNHAQTSSEIWQQLGGSPLVSLWMAHDMDIHTCAASDIEAFSALPGSEVLLLTGLAELHANADMFGAQQSTGYKIKYKHWLARARRYCKGRY
jgi:hypothetical protein